MKLRIHGNSLRLRLNQAEVAQFSKMGYYEDSVQFATGSSFSYAIECATSLQAPEAVFSNCSLLIRVPYRAGTEWATTDRVEISGDQPLQDGRHLSILIEKDFRCIHSETPEPDAYPNPLEGASCRHEME